MFISDTNEQKNIHLDLNNDNFVSNLVGICNINVLKDITNEDFLTKIQYLRDKAQNFPNCSESNIVIIENIQYSLLNDLNKLHENKDICVRILSLMEVTSSYSRTITLVFYTDVFVSLLKKLVMKYDELVEIVQKIVINTIRGNESNSIAFEYLFLDKNMYSRTLNINSSYYLYHMYNIYNNNTSFDYNLSNKFIELAVKLKDINIALSMIKKVVRLRNFTECFDTSLLQFVFEVLLKNNCVKYIKKILSILTNLCTVELDNYKLESKIKDIISENMIKHEVKNNIRSLVTSDSFDKLFILYFQFLSSYIDNDITDGKYEFIEYFNYECLTNDDKEPLISRYMDISLSCSYSNGNEIFKYFLVVLNNSTSEQKHKINIAKILQIMICFAQSFEKDSLIIFFNFIIDCMDNFVSNEVLHNCLNSSNFIATFDDMVFELGDKEVQNLFVQIHDFVSREQH